MSSTPKPGSTTAEFGDAKDKVMSRAADSDVESDDSSDGDEDDIPGRVQPWLANKNRTQRPAMINGAGAGGGSTKQTATGTASAPKPKPKTKSSGAKSKSARETVPAEGALATIIVRNRPTFKVINQHGPTVEGSGGEDMVQDQNVGMDDVADTASTGITTRSRRARLSAPTGTSLDSKGTNEDATDGPDQVTARRSTRPHFHKYSYICDEKTVDTADGQEQWYHIDWHTFAAGQQKRSWEPSAIVPSTLVQRWQEERARVGHSSNSTPAQQAGALQSQARWQGAHAAAATTTTPASGAYSAEAMPGSVQTPSDARIIVLGHKDMRNENGEEERLFRVSRNRRGKSTEVSWEVKENIPRAIVNAYLEKNPRVMTGKRGRPRKSLESPKDNKRRATPLKLQRSESPAHPPSPLGAGNSAREDVDSKMEAQPTTTRKVKINLNVKKALAPKPDPAPSPARTAGPDSTSGIAIVPVDAADLRCQVCGLQTSRADSLRRHLTRIHGLRYYCTVEGCRYFERKSFYSFSHLKEHMKSSHNEKITLNSKDIKGVTTDHRGSPVSDTSSDDGPSGEGPSQLNTQLNMPLHGSHVGEADDDTKVDGSLAVDDHDHPPVMDNAAMDDAAMGDAAMGDAAMGDAAMGDAAMGDAAMGDAAKDDAAMDDVAMDDVEDADADGDYDEDIEAKVDARDTAHQAEQAAEMAFAQSYRSEAANDQPHALPLDAVHADTAPDNAMQAGDEHAGSQQAQERLPASDQPATLQLGTGQTWPEQAKAGNENDWQSPGQSKSSELLSDTDEGSRLPETTGSNEEYACPECSKTVSSQKALSRHRSTAHGQGKQHYCHVAGCKHVGRGFGRLDHFKQHMERSHGMLIRTNYGTGLGSRTINQRPFARQSTGDIPLRPRLPLPPLDELRRHSMEHADAAFNREAGASTDPGAGSQANHQGRTHYVKLAPNPFVNPPVNTYISPVLPAPHVRRELQQSQPSPPEPPKAVPQPEAGQVIDGNDVRDELLRRGRFLEERVKMLEAQLAQKDYRIARLTRVCDQEIGPDRFQEIYMADAQG